MNFKFLGMIVSVFTIIIMVIVTIKGNFLIDDENDKYEDYSSGLIENQANEQNNSNLDFGFEKGDIAADFELQNLLGETVRLSDYRGKKVFLNFWASWCPPCKIEMPHMENYYNKYKDSNNVEIIAVNMTSKERKREIVQEFVDSYGLTFPVLLDNEGKVEKLYEVIGYPTTFLINEEGVVVDAFTTSVDENRIKELINSIE